MKKSPLFFILISFILASMGFTPIKKKPKVLIFSKTKGYRHKSIEVAKIALINLAKENNFEADTSENAELFSDKNLKQYATVLFLNTTGDILNDKQQIAFERYIQASGGYVGVHAAADTEYDWPWFGKLNGAYFLSHPKVQEAKFIIKDATHNSTKFLTDSVWIKIDELYNYKNINPDINVLITIDEKSYTGGKNGSFHPFAWYQNFEGGRAFYTGMGHTPESWKDINFLKHILGGLTYAIGDNKKLNYSKAKSKY
jgi:type 1 glutamine amidotransferase